MIGKLWMPAGPSPRSELLLRTLSGAAMASVALLVVWAGAVPVGVFWVAAGIAVFVEWTGMSRAAAPGPLRIIASLGLAVAAVALLAGPPILAALALVIALLGLAAFAQGRRDRGWALAGFGYASAVALIPLIVRMSPAGGAFGLFWMFAVVWATDIAAYFVGRAFGGPKLWPAVSPGKTWSGALGGAAAGIAAGLLLAALAERAGAPLPGGPVAVAVASLLGSIASQAGDLAESAMKRRFGVKDSGSLIPGHGGVMDRLDGFAALCLLLAAALAVLGPGGWMARP